MKRTLRFLSIMACTLVSLALSSQKASAQVTAINANVYDSASNYCSTPANVWAYVSWYTSGTIQTNDSITVYINYGDGNDTTYKVLTQSQGSISINHDYVITGIFQISVTLTNTNSVTTNLLGSVNTITNSCSNISGDVWIDGNNNCIFDSGEQVLEWHVVKVTNTTTSASYYAWINNLGHYSINVADGYTYDIQLSVLPSSLTPTCPNTTGIVSQAVSSMGTYTINLGYECNTGSVPTDFTVSGYANLFRPGFTRHMWIWANTDNFCAAYPATVTLYLDPLLSYVSTASGTTPSSTSGPIVWNVTSLDQLNSLWSDLNIATSNAAVLGDTLCNLVVITYGTVTDPNHSNDTVNICRLVSNSMDPNDKQVSPSEGPLGLISNGENLSYLINFQNTGNDTAYNITVVDTLSSNLNMNTFQLLEASHPVNVTWLPGNIINFRFENIYLPDMTTNEPLSHGHVSYKIKAKTGLSAGTQIHNTAHIYFDFNTAIITNTTLNTIEIPTNVQNVSNGVLSAKVYPNPANDELTITTADKNFSAQILDILGRPVATSMTNSGKAIINTATLANGMYILHINADGREMSTKINVQH